MDDEEPAEEWGEDMEEVEDGRGEQDRDEPVMEGSDEEFSDWEDFQAGIKPEISKANKIITLTRCSSWRLLMPLGMVCFAQKY